MEITIVHEPNDQAFYARIDGMPIDAELTYGLPMQGVMEFFHTFVEEEWRGKKVAEQLVKTGLDYARQQNYHIIATCPVVSLYIKRHPEYQALLAKAVE